MAELAAVAIGNAGLFNDLSEALEQPYKIGETTLRCAASIGLALYPRNANTLTGLLREADQAMYRNKESTRDAVYTATSR